MCKKFSKVCKSHVVNISRRKPVLKCLLCSSFFQEIIIMVNINHPKTSTIKLRNKVVTNKSWFTVYVCLSVWIISNWDLLTDKTQQQKTLENQLRGYFPYQTSMEETNLELLQCCVRELQNEVSEDGWIFLCIDLSMVLVDIDLLYHHCYDIIYFKIQSVHQTLEKWRGIWGTSEKIRMGNIIRIWNWKNGTGFTQALKWYRCRRLQKNRHWKLKCS